MEIQIQTKLKKLSPAYIAGYVDGEGCFSLSFRKDMKNNRPKGPVYYYWRAQFAINARKDEKELFDRIKYFFKCGNIYAAKKRNATEEIHYCVSNLEELKNVISPFFKKHQLQAKKKYDFELWSEAVDIMYKNKKIKANIEKGRKGFKRNDWDKDDLCRLLKLHADMQKYKAVRPIGLKHISIAHNRYSSTTI